MNVDSTAAAIPNAQTLHDEFVAGTLTEVEYDRALGAVADVVTTPPQA
jgi:hypothetical protein